MKEIRNLLKNLLKQIEELEEHPPSQVNDFQISLLRHRILSVYKTHMITKHK